MRNQQRELNDIKFDYTQDSDTVDGIAHELVTAEVFHALLENALHGNVLS